LWKSQIKKLQNYELADYRLRVGDYRFLFNIDDLGKDIYIFRILHRSKLY
jgi:mRNA interferase RelE/StbE